ncbi:hypothetical protein LBMAG57_22930 [Verrucomicrobiota bacterium]|nr:hypothetical protein LBMAG57_22930 [Verrucomicrobiota bacterium]
MCLEPHKRLGAARIGQRQIEQHDIEAAGVQHPRGVGDTRRRLDHHALIAFLRERDLQQRDIPRIVLDEQDMDRGAAHDSVGCRGKMRSRKSREPDRCSGKIANRLTAKFASPHHFRNTLR